MDKLAERAAFERGGTRLYDAILAKFQALTDGAGSAAELPSGISIAELSRIRAQEADHFRLVSGSIEELGADPTAATPSADLVGMESTGLLQAVSDPRTGLADCLHAALAAELIDHAGWELLIEMADQMSSARLADRFRAARREEEDHLRLVRGWYAQLIHSQG
jgi:rubrerythrin